MLIKKWRLIIPIGYIEFANEQSAIDYRDANYVGSIIEYVEEMY